MRNFTPGIVVHQFITKNGYEAIIRYPQPSVVEAMTNYINVISSEDTYVTVSGEQISKDEESKFLDEQFEKINNGDGVLLICTINGEIVGISGVTRNQNSRRRALHTGIFGISIKKEFRGQGIGHELAKSVIDQAKMNIDGMRIVTLTVYQPNKQAKQLYEKLGFKEYGYLPQGIWYKDSYIDEISMYLPVMSS